MSLIIKKNTTFKIPKEPSFTLQGLTLWLRANDGVSKMPYDYVSRIVISGTSNPDFNGIYTAIGTPTYSNGRVNVYYFSGPAGKSMSWSADEERFYLFADGQGFSSTDGITWQIENPYLYQIIIDGFTGIYSGANGTYTGSPDRWDRVGGGFFIDYEGLKDNDYETLIATPPEGYSGSWSPTSFINQVTIAGADNTPAVNGVYTRSYAGIGKRNSFTGPAYLAFDNGDHAWYLGNEDYRSFGIENLTTWYIFNEGTEPLPTGVTTTALNPIGSPISTIVFYPSGSISGSITISSAISNYVTSWADKSGNGNDAISSEGTRPTFESNTLNSKPVLRFDGTGQKMALTSSIGGTEYSIFIVCKNNDNEVGSMFLWATDNNYGKYIAVITDAGYNADARNKFILSEADAGGGGEGSVIAWSSAPATNSFFIGTATQNGGGKAYLNGYGGTDSLGTFIESNTFDLIGGYGFGYELDGDVAEIIAYNRVLTTPERQQVEAYLNSKYQIY